MLMRILFVVFFACLFLLSPGLLYADQQSALAKLEEADEEEGDAYYRNALAIAYEYNLGLDFDDADDWYTGYGGGGPFAPNYDVVDFLYDEEDGAEFYLGEVGDHKDEVITYQLEGTDDLDAGWTYYAVEDYENAEAYANSAMTYFNLNQDYLAYCLVDRNTGVSRINSAETDMAAVEAEEAAASYARNCMNAAKADAALELDWAEDDWLDAWYVDYTDAFLRYWTEIEPTYGPDSVVESKLNAAYNSLDIANTYFEYADDHFDVGEANEDYSDTDYATACAQTSTNGKLTNFGSSEANAQYADGFYDDCKTDAEHSQQYSYDATLDCEAAQIRMDEIEE